MSANQAVASSSDRLRLGMVPVTFVLLWSTGFIGGKLGLPYAEPFTFLALRMALVSALLLAVVWLTGAAWPATWRQAGHIAVAGLLVHAVYLGGVFSAIDAGLSAGVTALIVGVQPLLTAVAAGPLLGETVTARQWGGLVLGLAGVALVVSEKITLAGVGLAGFLFAVAALLGITVGTLYQKRFCGAMDLRTGAVIQYAACGVVLVVPAYFFETMRIQWTPEFIFALSWLSLVLSVGAISLLYMMIRRGAAARVASLFYLVPPVTALIAYWLFDERLGFVALVGMAVTVVGVALVTRK